MRYDIMYSCRSFLPVITRHNALTVTAMGELRPALGIDGCFLAGDVAMANCSLKIRERNAQ